MSYRLSDLVSSARMVSIPLRVKFRGITERELMLFEGPNGFMEWAAFPEYGDEEAATWLAAAIEWGTTDLPEPKRTRVPINAILPAVQASDVQKLLERAGKFETVKVKVAEAGQELVDDLDRVSEVRNLYPEAKIRLDANGSFTVAKALELISLLTKKDIFLEYFEQPVATIADLSELKLELSKIGSNLLIAADESVRKSTDPLAVELAGAVDILVLKSAPLGGIRTALDIADKSKLAIVASSAMQSSIGLAAELYFAASLPNLDFAAGLGTGRLFAGDLTKDPLVAEDGFMDVRRPEINLSSLDIFRSDDHRFDWWLERLERCGRILGLES